MTDHEQMIDAQSGCVPCKLCGGKAVITDAGPGAGYNIACENSRTFHKSDGCMLDERRLGGWAYNVRDWWNRLHEAPTPQRADAEDVEREEQARIDAWDEFAGEHLTDGKGYAAADVWKRCNAAFDAVWPSGRDAANAAALAAMPRASQQAGQTEREVVERVLEILQDNFGGAVFEDEYLENGHQQVDKHDALNGVEGVARKIVDALQPAREGREG